MYIENIREFVEDHNIIVSLMNSYTSWLPYNFFLQVTYKWLSREMGVPVNAAKQ